MLNLLLIEVNIILSQTTKLFIKIDSNYDLEANDESNNVLPLS